MAVVQLVAIAVCAAVIVTLAFQLTRDVVEGVRSQLRVEREGLVETS